MVTVVATESSTVTVVSATTPNLITAFTGLSDTPGNYTDDAGKLLAVNGGEDAVEFVTAASLGFISSVAEDATPELGGSLDGGAHDIAVDADQKIILDGPTGTSYLTFNSATSKLELWVLGVKKMQWG